LCVFPSHFKQAAPSTWLSVQAEAAAQPVQAVPPAEALRVPEARTVAVAVSLKSTKTATCVFAPRAVWTLAPRVVLGVAAEPKVLRLALADPVVRQVAQAALRTFPASAQLPQGVRQATAATAATGRQVRTASSEVQAPAALRTSTTVLLAPWLQAALLVL